MDAKLSDIIFDKNGLKIKLEVPNPTTIPTMNAKAYFLNTSAVPFNNLNFQLSLPKVVFY